MKKIILLSALAFMFSLTGFQKTFAEETEQTALPENALRPCAEFAGENEYCEILESNGSVKELFAKLKSTYHEDTNKYFNEKIKKLSGTSFQKDQKREQALAETELILVYKERQEELVRYQSALLTLGKKSGESVSEEATKGTTENALNSVSSLSEEISWESDLAEKALRLTFKSYSEMRMFYPLHKELESFITELQKLQEAWISFMKQIARMPAKFINASAKF